MGVEGRPQKVARLAVTLADLPQVNDGVSARDSDERWLRRWGGVGRGGVGVTSVDARQSTDKLFVRTHEQKKK